MNKLPALAFLLLGIGYFLFATSALSVTSETALVAGAMGLVPGILGAVAALIARKRIGVAIVAGLVVSVLAGGALVVFFEVIWPML